MNRALEMAIADAKADRATIQASLKRTGSQTDLARLQYIRGFIRGLERAQELQRASSGLTRRQMTFLLESDGFGDDSDPEPAHG